MYNEREFSKCFSCEQSQISCVNNFVLFGGINRTMASVGYAKGVVPLNEAKRFLKDCLMAVDTSQETAEQLAEVLVAADYRGHYSHGLNRLGMSKAGTIHDLTFTTEASSGFCSSRNIPKRHQGKGVQSERTTKNS